MRPAESGTQQGLRFFRYGIITLAALLVVVAMGNYFIGNKLIPFSDSTLEVHDNFALIVADLSLGILNIGLLGLSIVFIAIALGSFYNGRKEFGKVHEKNVKKAMTALLVATILIIISAILSGPSQTTEYEYTDGQLFMRTIFEPMNEEIFMLSSILAGILAVIGIACLILAACYLVLGLVKRKQISNLFMGMGIIIFTAIFWQSLYIYLVYTSNTIDSSDLMYIQNTTMLSVIPMIIGIFLTARVYSNIRKRIENGNLKPRLLSLIPIWLPPPQPQYYMPQGGMTQNDLSSIITSAKGQVEEITRIEIKIRTPISWIAVILLLICVTIYTNSYILFLIIPVVITSIYMMWAYKRYQTVYNGKIFGGVTLWHMLYWRTYLRNVQSHYSETNEYHPFVISNALLIIKDIEAYLKFKWTNVLMGVFLTILLSFQMRFLGSPTDNLSNMWLVMISFYIIILFIDLAILTFLHIRFRETKKKLNAFKTNIENFGKIYW